VDARFELLRLRFSLRAEGRVRFQAIAANTLRGAFGYALRDTAPEEFERIFSPRAPGRGPSGLADLPRPFVLRSRHLDGADFEAGQPFGFDAHLFDVRQPLAEVFTTAIAEMGRRGIGEAAGRAALDGAEPAAITLSLAPGLQPIGVCAVDFLTPTELKSNDGLAGQPLFPVVFARVRDRIATLQSLYGERPFDLDFRGMGERAGAVGMTASEIRLVEAARRSSRTGQRHPIGGFIGSASYSGPLAEFVPWLQAAAFTGVGRQTTWGKGEIRVRLSPSE